MALILRGCCVGAAWVLRGCCVGAACVLRERNLSDLSAVVWHNIVSVN